jgi:hypothetical protein
MGADLIDALRDPAMTFVLVLTAIFVLAEAVAAAWPFG